MERLRHSAHLNVGGIIYLSSYRSIRTSTNSCLLIAQRKATLVLEEYPAIPSTKCLMQNLFYSSVCWVKLRIMPLSFQGSISLTSPYVSKSDSTMVSIRQTCQRASQADGQSQLTIIGETAVSFARGDLNFARSWAYTCDFKCVMSKSLLALYESTLRPAKNCITFAIDSSYTMETTTPIRTQWCVRLPFCHPPRPLISRASISKWTSPCLSVTSSQNLSPVHLVQARSQIWPSGLNHPYSLSEAAEFVSRTDHN